MSTLASLVRHPDGDWVAELSCGHRRHVRHRPLLEDNPWVTTEAGRRARLGTALACRWCDAPVPPVGPGALARAAARRGAQVVDALAALDPADREGPTALPGWDRLTVACHLRFGARALVRLTEAARAGRPAAYYPSGRDTERPATLRPGPGETPAAVVTDLARATGALTRCWAALGPSDWDIVVHEPAGNADLGPLPLSRLALLRLTEVEVHGTDLRLGLPDWDPDFVRAALAFRLAWLPTRRANHRRVDGAVEGTWRLVATDGPATAVSVHRGAVRVAPAAGAPDPRATIEAAGRDLLALLLGRPARRAVRRSGDPGFARSFGAAFPGP